MQTPNTKYQIPNAQYQIPNTKNKTPIPNTNFQMANFKLDIITNGNTWIQMYNYTHVQVYKTQKKHTQIKRQKQIQTQINSHTQLYTHTFILMFISIFTYICINICIYSDKNDDFSIFIFINTYIHKWYLCPNKYSSIYINKLFKKSSTEPQ